MLIRIIIMVRNALVLRPRLVPDPIYAAYEQLPRANEGDSVHFPELLVLGAAAAPVHAPLRDGNFAEKASMSAPRRHGQSTNCLATKTAHHQAPGL